jgi:hypothetical protein
LPVIVSKRVRTSVYRSVTKSTSGITIIVDVAAVSIPATISVTGISVAIIATVVVVSPTLAVAPATVVA